MMKTTPRPKAAVTPDLLCLYTLPDSLKDAQRLKGLKLALGVISKAVAKIEIIIRQCGEHGESGQLYVRDIKREQRWIEKILKAAKIQNRFPLLGDGFEITMTGSYKLRICLESLALPKRGSDFKAASPVPHTHALRELKQKLSYNGEVLHGVSTLYAADYFLYDISPGTPAHGRANTQVLVFYELLTLLRRYCIRLTSSLLPSTLTERYFSLFSFLLKHIAHLAGRYGGESCTNGSPQLAWIINALSRQKNETLSSVFLQQVRSTLNGFLNNPHKMMRGVCVYD
jgi:hypothetical protein